METRMVVSFSLGMAASVLVATRDVPGNSDGLRQAIFWLCGACACICLFGLLAGIGALFRKPQRREGALLAGLALLVVPIFGLAGLLARMLR
jgi:peptidoglycan/LPS O-acetylase OafA/YrhL